MTDKLLQAMDEESKAWKFSLRMIPFNAAAPEKAWDQLSASVEC
jgi:hypothetical protein